MKSLRALKTEALRFIPMIMSSISVHRFRVWSKALVFILLSNVAAPAIFADDTIIGYASAPEPVKVDSAEMKMKKGFGTQFWLTTDDHVFLNWAPGGMQNLVPVKQVRRGTPIYLAIFFVNPAVGSRTNADGLATPFSSVEYRWGVEKPDGTKIAIPKPIHGWGGVKPTAATIQLADGRPCLTLDVMDPPGYYTFHVQVHDAVSGTDIDLERAVVLKE